MEKILSRHPAEHVCVSCIYITPPPCPYSLQNPISLLASFWHMVDLQCISSELILKVNNHIICLHMARA